MIDSYGRTMGSHRVHKVDTQPPRADATHWPIDVLLLTLGGFGVGTALAFQRFDDPLWYRSAWVSVIGVPWLVACGMVITRLVSRRWMRRSMQVGLLASLVLHLLLVLATVHVVLPARLWRPNEAAEVTRSRREVPRVEHLVLSANRPYQPAPFVPDPNNQVTAAVVDREPTSQEPQVLSNWQPVELAPSPDTPNLARRAVEVPAPARQAPTLSLLSKNTTRQPETSSAAHPMSVTEPGRVGPTAVALQLQPTRPQPTLAALQDPRAEVAPPVIRAAPATEPEAIQPRIASHQLPRRQSPEPTLSQESPQEVMAQQSAPATFSARKIAVAPQRHLPASLGVEQAVAELASEQPSDIQMPDFVADETDSLIAQVPEPLSGQRRVPIIRPSVDLAPSPISTTTSDAMRATAADVTVSRALSGDQRTLALAGRLPEENKETLAASSAPSELSRAALSLSEPPLSELPTVSQPRRSTSASRPNFAGHSISDTPLASSSPIDPTNGLRPTDVTLERQVARGEQLPSRQPAEQPQSSPEATLAESVFRRQLSAPEASLQPLARPEITANRAVRNAETQSPPLAEQPSPQVGKPPVQPTPAPMPLAIARAAVGTAGAQAGPNLLRDLPAADSPALFASGASHLQATQEAEPAAALSPSIPSWAARTASRGPVPGSLTTAPLAPEGSESVPLVHQPAAAASVADTSLAAQVERGSVTVDQGPTEVDLGPQRVVAEMQVARGLGGGQPELWQIPAPATMRASRSGLPRPSLPTDTQAPVAVAPAAPGGSRPLAIDASPTAVRQMRLDPAGTASTSGSPSEAPLEGSPAEANAADALAQVNLRQAPSTEATSPMGLPGLATSSPAARGRTLPSVSAPVLPTESSSETVSLTSRVPSPADLAVSPGDLAASPMVVRQADQPARAASATGAAATIPDATLSAAGKPGQVLRVRSNVAEAVPGPALPGSGGSKMTRSVRSPVTGIGLEGQSAAEQVALASSASDPTPAPAIAQSVGTQYRPSQPEMPSALEVSGPTGMQSYAHAQLLEPSRVMANREQVKSEPHPIASTRSSGVRTAPRLTSATETLDGLMADHSRSTGNTAVTPADLAVVDSDRPGVRPAEAQLPVDVDRSPGDGGLGVEVASDVGLEDRRARREAETVQMQLVRIPRRTPSGLPSTLSAATIPTDAFRGRVERNRPETGRQLGPETERAIELGLAFLARYQRSDGRWTLDGFDEPPPVMRSDVAATGLALLAFQGAGYTHREYQYRDIVRRGIDYLLSTQQADGVLFAESDPESNRVARLYSHAIATLALTEAYGMTQDPLLRQPAQRALDYIVAAQSPELGGWRYTPQVSSDTSVSGWMLMALKSGELAGLSVPKSTYQRVIYWLDRAQAPKEPYLYRYNPYAPDTPAQRHGRVPSPTMTSVGLLMRLYTGWRRDHPALQAGGDYLRDNLPGMSDLSDPVASRRRDTYYWYYATQVMFHLGGEYWRTWNGKLHPLLLSTQVQEGPYAGSWDPFRPVPDRWAAHAGRIYVTTMNLLSLEVTYRHLPLYELTSQ